MFGSIFASGKWFRVGRRCFAAMLAACLALSGCTNLDLCDDRPVDDRAPDLLGALRPAENGREFFGVSNKAREIEQNCMR